MAVVEYWKIDNEKEKNEHTITGKEVDLQVFSFVVKRMKDQYTYQEVLKITAYYKGNEYGTIVAKMQNLDQDIKQLANIGIFLSPLAYKELGAIISSNYYKFTPIFGEGIENNIPDKVVEGIRGLLMDAVKEYGIQEQNGFYDMPTDIFNSTINESAFRKYNVSDIKEALKIRNLTKCNQNRNDYAVKVDGKTKRFIRICK